MLSNYNVKNQSNMRNRCMRSTGSCQNIYPDNSCSSSCSNICPDNSCGSSCSNICPDNSCGSSRSNICLDNSCGSSCSNICPDNFCSREVTRDCKPGSCAAANKIIPVSSPEKLLNFIDEISFVVYETVLYLDTHPEDPDALNYFHEHNTLRDLALQEYAKRYGPLTVSTISEAENGCWKWMNQPWPWEGGSC